MQTTQKQRSEHLKKAHEKAKEVVKKLRGKNRSLEKELQQANGNIAELGIQLGLKDAITESKEDLTEPKEGSAATLKGTIVKLKEEKQALVLQNNFLQEQIEKVRIFSESEVRCFLLWLACTNFIISEIMHCIWYQSYTLYMRKKSTSENIMGSCTYTVSFPEPTNFLRHMLNENEGSGKDQS